MRLKLICKRLTALILAVLMVLSTFPMAVYAEEMASDVANATDTVTDFTVTENEPSVTEPGNSEMPMLKEAEDEELHEPSDDTENMPVADATGDTTLNPDTETEVEEENPNDGMSDGIPVDGEQTENEDAAAGAPEKLSDDTSGEVNEDDSEQQDSDTEELSAPVLRSAASPSRFTGNEAIRLGKEGNNIYGIIVQKDGSSSTSITRHWVTVDGVKYTAYCIEASDASTSGRDGGLEPGTDAGLLWILNNVPEDSDEDYAIKQQAIWAYLGQSFTIRNLAAGSRCSLSTDQLRERLTDIVTNAQNASLAGSQELWIAYHLDNRSYYQDMAFTVAEPPPSITPTPVPTPTPTPTPIPITGSIRVMKSDASTGSALTGAVFQLMDAAFAPVGSPIITDASGIAEWTNLLAGDYYVQEIQAPEGYQVDDALYSASITENGQLLTIEMTNEVIEGKIRITKVDADTQDTLSGAIFTVTDVSGAIVATLTTDADGSAETDWLPYGSYTITEVQAPDGYINSGFTTVIEATENGKTYTIHVENTAMQGGIRLTKTDASNGRAIANGVYVLEQTAGKDGYEIKGPIEFSI